jgi:hypothetical protein
MGSWQFFSFQLLTIDGCINDIFLNLDFAEFVFVSVLYFERKKVEKDNG